jgi:hypothetical protein
VFELEHLEYWDSGKRGRPTGSVVVQWFVSVEYSVVADASHNHLRGVNLTRSDQINADTRWEDVSEDSIAD